MNKPRYTPEDFENTRFAAIKTKDGRYSHFLKTDVNDLWLLGSGGSVTLDYLIERGAFPVFPEPYSPEALKFAWDHAAGTEGDPEFVDVGQFEGTSSYLSYNGTISVTSVPGAVFLGPTERILYQKPVRKTSAEKIAELLEKEAVELSEKAIENVSAAIADLGDDLIDILEG